MALSRTRRCAGIAAAMSLTTLAAAAMAASKSVLADFGFRDGGAPFGSPIYLGSKFYGVTSNEPTIYSVTTDGVRKMLHRFTHEPAGRLLNVGGTLYGTTFNEGAAAACRGQGCGTIYSITPDGAYTTLYTFQGGKDGAFPNSGLINVGGTLYGTTSQGGGSSNCADFGTGCGTVFAMTPQGAEKVIYRFQGGSDGGVPNELISDGNNLYGSTAHFGNVGGGDGGGTVFSLTPAGTLVTIHSFNGDNSLGVQPLGRLLKLGNALYGTTDEGGACTQAPSGTVFEVSLTGAFKLLHSFCYPSTSSFGLTERGGLLYGVDPYGGSLLGTTNTRAGAVFSITPQGTFSTVYEFKGGSDGATPSGELVDVGGTLLGVTLSGGADCGVRGCGTLFSFTP